MAQYIFEHNKVDRELKRLRMIERAVDADTIALLEQAGVAVGWACLEVGAGAGSIVQWLASRVGATGHVAAVDKKTAYLTQLRGPTVQVYEGNLLDVALDRAMDLVHGRYVLIHNANDGMLLRNIRSRLKPGGVIVLEEPDFTSALLLQPQPDDMVRRVNGAICKMFQDGGLNPAYGLALPERVAGAGFDVIRTDSRLHLCPGGAPIAEVMAESAVVLRDQYTKTGLATDDDIDHYVSRAQDAAYWAVYYATVSVWARVP